MKTPIHQIKIHELPAGTFKLTIPVEVAVYRETDGAFRAAAPELGMWVDGFGETTDAAISDLCDAIVEQRRSVAEVANSQCSEYAQTIKAVFEERFVED